MTIRHYDYHESQDDDGTPGHWYEATGFRSLKSGDTVVWVKREADGHEKSIPSEFMGSNSLERAVRRLMEQGFECDCLKCEIS